MDLFSPAALHAIRLRSTGTFCVFLLSSEAQNVWPCIGLLVKKGYPQKPIRKRNIFPKTAKNYGPSWEFLDPMTKPLNQKPHFSSLQLKKDKSKMESWRVGCSCGPRPGRALPCLAWADLREAGCRSHRQNISFLSQLCECFCQETEGRTY